MSKWRENYETYEEKVKAVINPVDIRGLTAAVRSGLVYNGQDQELLDKIIGLKDGDRVSFVVSALGDEPQSKEWTEWTEENRPRACDAGIYKVRVKVERDNYNETEIIPCPEVCIQRAEPELQFAEEPKADTVDFDRQGDNTYNFSVICNALQPQNITYSVENAAKDDDTDIGDIASIVESGENAGKLTITQAGHIIRITAATAGSENYTSVSQTYVLAIRDTDEDLIGFEKREVSRTLKMEDVIFEQAAEKSHEDDNGEITYEGKVTGLAGELKDFGIELAGSGRVSVKDLELLSEVLEKEGSLSLVITASKGEGTKEYEGGPDVYMQDAEPVTPSSYPRKRFRMRHIQNITRRVRKSFPGTWSTGGTIQRLQFVRRRDIPSPGTRLQTLTGTVWCLETGKVKKEIRVRRAE